MRNQDVKTENYCLMFGDCLERMKEIPDGSVEMDENYFNIGVKRLEETDND